MKSLRLLLGIFSFLGVTMTLIAGFLVVHTRQFISRAVSAPGNVIENVWRGSNSDSSDRAHPKIRFRTGTGQEFVFVSNFGSSPPSYRVNEAVTVLYDPEDPNRASIQSFFSQWFAPILVGGLGLVFASAGLIPMLVMRRSAANDEWLRINGQRIQARFERVELNTSVEVNGSNPYRLVCQWHNPVTNQVHVFKSHNIWYDPAGYIGSATLDVLLDPNNYKRYLVETSFLPKVAQ
jgi:hypothetical protein